MAHGYSVRQYTLTLTGVAQSLAAAFATPAAGGADDIPVQQILLQPDSANSNIIKVGDADVASTLYAFELAKPVTSIPPAPVSIGPLAASRIKPSTVYVLGTNNEKLHFLLIGF